jgi:hypothetical protein
MPSSQRPFLLSSFFAVFRQQPPSALSASAQSNKTTHHTHLQASAAGAGATTGARPISTSAAVAAAAASSTSAGAVEYGPAPAPSSTTPQRSGAVINQIPIHSPRAHHHHHHHHGGVPIPGSSPGGRRRGSDSSSEGFRDVIGGDKWYIGGRTAGGEEKFFKLGVVRRIKSNDRLSLDRLSL